tara:strand:+ start:2170 stop:2796 length:627 start_codon:yes stop_codon:yes gene_type:complete
MVSVFIKRKQVKLVLTSPRSKIRICDDGGNHIPRPSKEGIYDKKHYVEWMITNNEIGKLAKYYLSKKDVKGVINRIKKINKFLRDSKYYVRKANKRKLSKKFSNFEVYEYKEKFYSFERNLNTKMKVKVTFKMGDYTLAAHMFVLLSFFNKNLQSKNNAGKLKINSILGSGAHSIWKPSKKQIIEIIYTLAHSSENHRNDLIDILHNI